MTPADASHSGSTHPHFAELAEHLGIILEYTDGLGTRRSASTDALLAVFAAMGHGVASPEQAASELRRQRDEQSLRLLESVNVLWGGSASMVVLRVSAMNSEVIDVRIDLESGDTIEWRARRGEFEFLNDRERGLLIDRPIPDGFHTLTLTTGGREHRSMLIAAPMECYMPEHRGTELGVFMPLYALRSGNSFGTGSLGELGNLQHWAREQRVRYVGTLPILSTFLDDPFEPSPYAPISRSIFGELFIDVRDAARRHPLETLRGLLASASFEAEIDGARARTHVDYKQAWAIMRQCLDAAADDLWSHDALRAQIESFAREDTLIERYAQFRAQRSGEPEQEYRMYVCAQWLLAEQLGRLADGGRDAHGALYLDLPVGAHGGGFDAHLHPELFAFGASLGAPPDALFQGGQTWGFPPSIPNKARELGHRDFITSVDRHLRYASALRIDHAAGLHRCFWVPDGFSATDGVYVRYPDDEHFAILSVLSHRHKSLIIGENLGTIPPEVDEGIERHGILGMRIAQFEMGLEHAALPEISKKSLVALNTHDMPTFDSFWNGRDIDLLSELGFTAEDGTRAEHESRRARIERTVGALREHGYIDREDPSERDVLRALLQYFAATDASLLVVNLEDLWLEPDPQNVPGTVDEYPNWKRKASRSLEEFTGDGSIASLFAALRSAPSPTAPPSKE